MRDDLESWSQVDDSKKRVWRNEAQSISDFNADKFNWNCAKCSNLALVKEGEERELELDPSHGLGTGNVLGADGLR